MDAVYDAAKKYDKDLILKEKQLEVFNYLISVKGDLLVNLPVGYGKSILYHSLPEILLSVLSVSFLPLVIVISPLNIIQKDQLSELKSHGIAACKLDIKARIQSTTEDDSLSHDVLCSVPLCDLTKNKYSLLLCHPEALLNTEKGKDLLQKEEFQRRVVAVVIDECHIIDKWSSFDKVNLHPLLQDLLALVSPLLDENQFPKLGEDFRKAFKKLGSLKAFFPNSPIVALSGTLTREQKVSLPKVLALQDYAAVEASPDRKNIYLEKVKKEANEDVLGQYERICM